MLDDPLLDVISIDNLPSVLALEASHAFAELLLPALLAYPEEKGWVEAKKVGLSVFVLPFLDSAGDSMPELCGWGCEWTASLGCLQSAF